MQPSRYNIAVEGADDVLLLYNGRSGALLSIGQPDCETMRPALAPASTAAQRRDSLSSLDLDLVEMLVAGHMLVPDECDELEILRSQYEASRYDATTLGLVLVTSLGCNFDCPYCFEDKHGSVMNARVQSWVLDHVRTRIASIDHLAIQWYGGEPLVGKRPLYALSKALIAMCDAGGVQYRANMVTNGSLLTRQVCQELAALKVDRIQVTLDGPAAVHDRMRPAAKTGAGTFWSIVNNLRHAVDYFTVSVRVNVDRTNVDEAALLLDTLNDEGFSGRLGIYLGQIHPVDDGAPSPSAVQYRHEDALSRREFLEARRNFNQAARAYGFSRAALPRPTGAPCTAVRANELVVGSHGELYKCYESVGNPREVIGSIRDSTKRNSRLSKWLNYDPFSDDECRSCVALPVCMGGCAHHALDQRLYADRCDEFRDAYRLQIKEYAAAQIQEA